MLEIKFALILFSIFWTNCYGILDQNEATTIANNYITQVAPLAISSTDPLGAMAMLSANASTFANITATAMKLIMDSMNNNGTVVESEFEVLKTLHNYIAALFEQIDKIVTSKRWIIGDSLGRHYYDNIHEPVEMMMPEAIRVTDPMIKGHSYYVSNLEQRCKGINSPTMLLIRLRREYVGYCPLMTQQQIGLFAVASTAFGPLDQIVENRYTTPEVQDYFIDRADYLYRMIRYKGEFHTIEEFVNRLEEQVNEIVNLDGQMFKFAIFQLLNSAPYRMNREWPFLCTLDAVLVRHQFKRDRILDMVEFIRLSLVRLMHLMPICTTVFTTDPASMYYDTEDLTEKIVKIAKHVHKWTLFYLGESWPGMMINVAQNVARKHELKTPNSWNQTAVEISTGLNKMGLDGYNHQVLLTPPWDSVKWFHAEFEPNDGFVVKKFNDLVNIVVVRYKRDVNTYNRLKSAYENAANLSQVARQIIDINWNSDDMAHVLGTINNQTAGLNGPHSFNAAILIHNSKWLKGDCQIPTGHSDGYLNDTLTYNYIDYHKNSFFKGCQDFKLFHLL